LEGRSRASHEGNEVSRGFPGGKSPDGALREEKGERSIMANDERWAHFTCFFLNQACLVA